MSALSRATTARSGQLVRPRVESAAITLAVASLATVIMLQSMRVLVSYLVVVVGQANRTNLEIDTFAIFLAIALAPLAIRLAGLQRILALTAGVIAVIRLALQFWSQPNARLIMSAAIVILWGWLTVTLLTTDRRTVALGVLAGLTLDVAIRVAFLTLDLPWNSGVAAGVVTALVAAALLAMAALAWSTQIDPEYASGWSVALIAVGPGLAMFHLIGGNLGLAQTKAGLNFAPAMSLLGLGLLTGTLGHIWLEREYHRRTRWISLAEHLMVVAIGSIALWLFWTQQRLAPYALPFVVAVNLMLIGAAFRTGDKLRQTPRTVVPTIWFTLGLLLQVGILFYYYDASGRTRYMLFAAVALAVGSAFGALSSARRNHDDGLSSQTIGMLVIPAIILVLVCGWQFIATKNPGTGTALPATFKVMTYNLQDGFAADNSFDLEAQADVIEAAHPDVIVLQEVSRGWLVTSGADEALWLSQRLDMPIYFGGNSDDGLWGNAILTRAPVSQIEQHHFTVTKNLKRGTIETLVPTTVGNVWVVGTHLDNPKAADDIRLEQTQQLIANQTGRYPAIVMGDFNADPGTDVLNTFAAAGLTDPGATLMPNVTTTTDQRRLDYVLVSNQFTVNSMQAIQSGASDHKPVFATVTLSH